MPVTIDASVQSGSLSRNGQSHVFRMSDGAWVVVSFTTAGLRYAISTNSGASWTNTTVSTSATNISELACSVSGNTIYGAYITATPALRPFSLAYSTGSQTITATLGASSTSLSATASGISCAYDSNSSAFHVGLIQSYSGFYYAALFGFGASSLTQAGTGAWTAYSAVSGGQTSCLCDTSGHVWLTFAASGNNLGAIAASYASGSYLGTGQIQTGTAGTPQLSCLTLPGGTTSPAVLVYNDSGALKTIALTLSGTFAWGTPTTLIASAISGAPALAAASASTSDLVATYTTTANQANGEIYEIIRTSGVWQTPVLVVGGASTGWAAPTLAGNAAGQTAIPLAYITGTSSYALVSNSVSLFTAPSAPTGLQPSSSGTAPTTGGSFSFTYNNTNANDGMSAYNATIYKASDNSVVWTSTKTTASCAAGGTYTFSPSDSLVAGTNYYWSVVTYDQANLVSPTSSNATFTAVTVPVTTVTSPSNGGTVATSALTVTWSYNDPGGNAQASYQVQLLASDNTTILQDTGTLSNVTARSATLSYTLINGTVYYVQVRTTNSVGGTSTYSNVHFTATFAPPDLPGLFKLTPINDSRGTRIVANWDDGRVAGRNFAPATGPYAGNWLQLSTGDTGETWAASGTATAAATAVGDTGQYIEGTGALKLSSTGTSGTVIATRTATIGVSMMTDGATPILAGDLLSCAIYLADWSKITPASCSVTLTVNGLNYVGTFTSSLLRVHVPTSGSGWWHFALPLSALSWPQGSGASGVLTLTSVAWTITVNGAALALWIDDVRIIRYAGHTARPYVAGYNTLAQIGVFSDSSQSYVAGQYATPANNAGSYLVSDSNGLYWSISQNTYQNLTVSPLEGQSSLTPVGAFTIWRSDFLELPDNGIYYTTWRTYHAENGEVTSGDTYTYGVGIPPTGGSSVALCQTMPAIIDGIAQAQRVGAAIGNMAQGSSIYTGIVLRASPTIAAAPTYYSGEYNVSTLAGRIRLMQNGVSSNLATSSGGPASVQYIRFSAVGTTLTLWVSADGTNWTQIISTTDSTLTQGFGGIISAGTLSTRFDQSYLRRGGYTSCSATDPLSYDVLSRLSAQNPTANFARIAAAVGATSSVSSPAPPGTYTLWHIAAGSAYDVELTINGAGGVSITTTFVAPGIYGSGVYGSFSWG